MPVGKHYDLDTDITLANNSDSTIASQKATKTYVDNNYVPNSALEEAATVAKTGDYNDLINKPTIPTTTDSVTSGSTAALTSGGAYTNLVRRKSTTTATGGSNQGVYVDANGQVQACNATTSTYSSTGTTAVNGTAVASALGSYIPRNFDGSVAGNAQALAGVAYGSTAKPKGYFTNFNLLHAVEDKFFGADRSYKLGDTPATITCNYLVTNMVDGNYSGYNTSINPSTAFSTTPFVWEITRTAQFEATDVCNLYLVGHRLTYTMNVTDYKLEVAYKYSGGVFSWGTLIDYSGSAINILNKHYGVYYSNHGGSSSYHGVFGIRLTISGATSTAFSLSEVMLLCSRGTERVASALNTIDGRNGGKVTGNITIPTEYGSFVGNLTGNADTATKATEDGDGNTISTTYLKSHQSIKTLKTDNTTSQTASSSETIAGTGTINLHKVSKTGSYNDLLDKPTIPTVNNSTITIQKNGTNVDSFTTNASSNKSINITMAKSDVGLGNVDNTSDANKPISTATQTALDGKANKTNIINGAPLSNSSSYFFATSSTAAATVQKEVSIPSITELNVGQIIIVKPTVTSTVANSTIKLNDFDAYPMRYNNAAITTSTDSVVWSASYPSIWVFDGTYWLFAGHGVDSDTTYSNMSVAEGTTGTATSQRTMRADYLKQIIQGTVLTGLDTTTATVIDATDTILSALGKLQAQIDEQAYAATFIDWE